MPPDNPVEQSPRLHCLTIGNKPYWYYSRSIFALEDGHTLSDSTKRSWNGKQNYSILILIKCIVGTDNDEQTSARRRPEYSAETRRAISSTISCRDSNALPQDMTPETTRRTMRTISNKPGYYSPRPMSYLRWTVALFLITTHPERVEMVSKFT
jgi:hypothetical protein